MKKNPDASNFIPIDQIATSSVAYWFTYPFRQHAGLEKRMEELYRLDIDGIYDAGLYELGTHRLIGIGYQGVVMYARRGSAVLALKVRRQNATVPSFENEACCQKIGNGIGVGPNLLGESPNYLLMEYFPGLSFLKWLKRSDEKENPQLVRSLLKQILTQGYKLDRAGLDHGALSSFWHHVLIHNQQARLIDFSNSSLERKPSNLTSLASGLFIGRLIPDHLHPYFPMPDKKLLIPLVQKYKRNPSEKEFEAILQFTGV